MKMNLYVKALWRLSRVPFLSVGILPLILGYVLAWRSGYRGAENLYLLSFLAVVFIMWMTYYLGERNDFQGDRLNRDFNQFSGGSRVLVQGALPDWVPIFLGYGCLTGAVFLVSYIFFHFHTGPWTLPLGGVGILCGFYYSNQPFRWAYRGLGEILIGFCYGWLPIATGYYLFTGFFSHHVFLLSIPVSLSVFNVILINEFPDEEADRLIGKRNLVVRYGKEKMVDLYLGLSVLVGLSFVKVTSMFHQTPYWLFFIAGVPVILILMNFVRIWRRGYKDSKGIKALCRDTLFINLTITMILTVQQTLLSSTPGR